MNIIPWRDRNGGTLLRTDFDDLFNRFLRDDDWSNRLPATFRKSTLPPVNIAESEKTWTVTCELPGLNEKDIQLQVMGNQLMISGERKWEEEKKNKEFHRVESQYGAFQRSITLPDNIRTDADGINATYKRGMLEITLPKVEPTPTARIQVKSG